MTDLHMPMLRQANPKDWEVVEALLIESGLPVDDLCADNLDDFLVAEDGVKLVGLIGLQLYVSPLWLAKYRFGPVEWMWRSLTYWERQPMRRPD